MIRERAAKVRFSTSMEAISGPTHQSTDDSNQKQNNWNKKYDFRQPNRRNGNAAES